MKDTEKSAILKILEKKEATDTALDFCEKCDVHPSYFIVFRAGRDCCVESSLRDNQQNIDLQHDWDFPENLIGLLEIYERHDSK